MESVIYGDRYWFWLFAERLFAWYRQGAQDACVFRSISNLRNFRDNGVRQKSERITGERTCAFSAILLPICYRIVWIWNPLADMLNAFKLGGFQLGFWFAQQGSIYVFLVLIFVYSWFMNRLDDSQDHEDEG